MGKVMLNARLEPEEYAAIERKAKELGVSITGLIRMLAKAEVKIVVEVKREEKQ
ncbi:MAG: hypothetical protein SCK57_08575 [Bacillota bacterium]|nr:hypothetical protein [Bacillota bacterium]MDW7677702.1 hypothetical protein [Bacillota bacterium]